MISQSQISCNTLPGGGGGGGGALPPIVILNGFMMQPMIYVRVRLCV